VPEIREVEKMRQLMAVALGEKEADLAIINGDIVNVYTGEVLKGDTILVKGDRIAYVGSNAEKSIGSRTEVIDAKGKVVIPGFIDGHTHIHTVYSIEELVKYAIKGGTTTIITETSELANPLGYEVVSELLRAAKNQPLKIFFTLPAMGSISPSLNEHAITADKLRKLVKKKEVLGLGESYWAQVIGGDQRLLELIAESKAQGKKVEGHSSGARGNKLQAYIATGVSSCHEPITAEEVLERLRLGLFVLVREGEIRRELEAISTIKDEGISFNRLVLSTDGLSPRELVHDGWMDFVVQKAIKLGWSPVLAIQMATINIAQHFALDDILGGIAPGRFADLVIIPDLKRIKPEWVINNGQVLLRDGELIFEPRKHNYSQLLKDSIRLFKDFKAGDFAIPVKRGQGEVKVRVIDQVTDLITQEAVMNIPVSDGELKPDTSRDLLKVAAIDRSYSPGKSFVGFIRGIGLKSGTIATSAPWDSADIMVLGASEADMAGAVNRIMELHGGIVVYASGKVLAELPLPLGGVFSTAPMEVLAKQMDEIDRAAASLGCTSSHIKITLSILSTSAIPYLRICEQGLFNIRENRFVDLIVG